METPRPDKSRNLPWSIVLGALLVLAGCAPEAPPAPGRPAPSQPPPQPPARPQPPPAPFTRLRVTTTRDMLALQAELGAERFQEVLKLNRIDLRHLRQGDEIVLPPRSADWKSLAPFAPVWEEVRDLPRLLVVSLRLQAWAAYEDGQLVRWGPASTGKKDSPTPAGLYHTNWCQRERRSTFNGEWQLKWYVNLHNRSGISFHQYDLPGYPGSHSCIRLAADDAEWIYRWCRQWKLSPDQRTVLSEGTPVVVFGDYGWGQPKPWKRLADDAQAHRVAAAELEEALRILRQRVAPQDPDPARAP